MLLPDKDDTAMVDEEHLASLLELEAGALVRPQSSRTRRHDAG